MKKGMKTQGINPVNAALIGVGVVAVGGTLYYLSTKSSTSASLASTAKNNLSSSTFLDDIEVVNTNLARTATPTLLSVTTDTITYSGVTNNARLLLYANGTYANISKNADGASWTSLSLSNGTAYTLVATESGKLDSLQSNSITPTASTVVVVAPPSQPVSAFTNILKTIPVELVKGKYNPHLFPVISCINSFDTLISTSKQYPNWVIAWQCEGSNFKNNNRTTPQLGIPFMYDRNPNYYAGYGEHGLDFVYDQNPNNGCAWGQERVNGVCTGNINNIDTLGGVNVNWETFTSRIPFSERAYANFGLAGDSNRIKWDNNTLEECYDDGVNAASANQYGHGDMVNGKVNTGFTNADIEIGYEVGESGTNKHAAFLMGMASRSLGPVISQYSAAFMPTGISKHFYADANGNFPQYRLNIDGSQKLNDLNQPIPNTTPQSSDWNPLNKFTITGRGITNKSLFDFPNAWMCTEVSSLASDAFRQGQQYDRTGNNNMVTVNKYGVNANTQHIVAYTRHVAEINKWWSVNKLNNRRVVLQSKITCDRSNMGIFIDAGFTNSTFQFYHHGRRFAHMIGGVTALSGCEWNIWDRNTDENLDGYHGVLALINLLKQKKDFGNGVSESFESLKLKMNFLLWNSEISYDNGSTWKKETADAYVMDYHSIIQSQAITNDGYWGGYLCRSEGGENTTCKLRVTYNGQVHYYTVTADMWESTSKEHETKALADIPVMDKDFHYFLVKLT